MEKEQNNTDYNWLMTAEEVVLVNHIDLRKPNKDEKK